MNHHWCSGSLETRYKARGAGTEIFWRQGRQPPGQPWWTWLWCQRTWWCTITLWSLIDSLWMFLSENLVHLGILEWKKNGNGHFRDGSAQRGDFSRRDISCSPNRSSFRWDSANLDDEDDILLILLLAAFSSKKHKTGIPGTPVAVKMVLCQDIELRHGQDILQWTITATIADRRMIR